MDSHIYFVKHIIIVLLQVKRVEFLVLNRDLFDLELHLNGEVEVELFIVLVSLCRLSVHALHENAAFVEIAKVRHPDCREVECEESVH